MSAQPDFKRAVLVLLRERKWSQAYLAARMGIDVKNVEQVLRHNNPTLRTLSAYAEGFDLNAAEFMSRAIL